MIEVLLAKAAWMRDSHALAVLHLEKAAQLQSGWMYMEPAHPLVSVRLCLAEMQLRLNDLVAAKKHFREDLKSWPDTGYARLGLYHACRLQDKEAACEIELKMFDHTWRDADWPLENSCPMLFQGRTTEVAQGMLFQGRTTETAQDVPEDTVTWTESFLLDAINNRRFDLAHK